MNKNNEESSKNDGSSLSGLLTVSVIICIILAALILTPFGNILSEELTDIKFFNSLNNEITKKDNIGTIENENKKVAFTYTVQYNHLGTEKNILLDGTVFFSFPTPMIDNEPAVNVNPKGNDIENCSIKLLAYRTENEEKTVTVQMENGIKGKLIDPRQKVNFYSPFILESENLTPKIKTQSSGDLFTTDFRKGGEKGGAIYENESILLKTKFSVRKEQIERVTLQNENVSAKVIGTTYSPENGHTHIPIKYSVTVSLSRETSDGQEVEKYRFKAEEPIPKNKSVELKKVT